MVGKDFETVMNLHKVIDICENHNISYEIDWEVEESGCTVFFDTEDDLQLIQNLLK